VTLSEELWNLIRRILKNYFSRQSQRYPLYI